jgi:hypothetical protein
MSVGQMVFGHKTRISVKVLTCIIKLFVTVIKAAFSILSVLLELSNTI